MIILGFDQDVQDWLGSQKFTEEIGIMFTNGKLLITHPEIFQQISKNFSPLSTDRFKRVIADFWLPQEAERHIAYN